LGDKRIRLKLFLIFQKKTHCKSESQLDYWLALTCEVLCSNSLMFLVSKK